MPLSGFNIESYGSTGAATVIGAVEDDMVGVEAGSCFEPLAEKTMTPTMSRAITAPAGIMIFR